MARRSSGFTLIELLVAIGLMALMAALTWRGLDGMSRAQSQLRTYSDDVLTLQAGLAQWGADLDAMTPQPDAPGLEWDGRSLKILRHNPTEPEEGLRVVAWTLRQVEHSNGHWLRWQSEPFMDRRGLQAAWARATQWTQNPNDEIRQREVAVVPLANWQIYFFRNNAWSNPMSSAAEEQPEQPTSAVTPPEAVRLVLQLPPGQAVHGQLTRDWVRATLGGGK